MLLRLALVVAVLYVPCAKSLVVAVSHAAGRMGVSVVGQLREQWQLASELQPEDLKIRAIVRTDEEAARLQLDLCGGVLRGGKLVPLLDLEEDLGVELHTCRDDSSEQAGLTAAFAGADVAVLLSAAHTEFTPANAEDLVVQASIDVNKVATGSDFLDSSSTAYDAVKAAGKASGINVLVPAVTGAAASRRLGAELACVTAPGSTLKHVVLRSSMGTGSLESISTIASMPAKERALATMAIARMGGAATIAAQADAESALRMRCGQRSIEYTVLRLGALVDSAGGVPLAFGDSDAQLLSKIDEEGKEPPLISRNDAARLVADIVTRGLGPLAGATIDVAWQQRYGVTSAGTEETSRKGAVQDLVKDASGGYASWHSR